MTKQSGDLRADQVGQWRVKSSQNDQILAN